MERFQIIAPSAILAPYIKHYWILTTDATGQEPQRIIPTGNISLIFHRGELMQSLSAGTRQPRTFICGQSIGYTDLLPTGIVNMISVVFRPHGTGAFFTIPANELFRQQVSPEELKDTSLKELEDRLSGTFDDPTAIRLIEQHLLKRLIQPDEYNRKRIAAVIRSIDAGRTIDALSLAQTACLGYKQFKRTFAEQVGANPKEYLRIIRFQRALHLLQHLPLSTAQLAYECGCYDQPHLIKEFKVFSGYTPGEYLRNCSPYSDYFS